MGSKDDNLQIPTHAVAGGAAEGGRGDPEAIAAPSGAHQTGEKVKDVFGAGSTPT